MDEEQIKLTDLIGIDTLQLIQDTFCEMCNIAIGITDENGVMITEGAMASEFCRDYNKKSPIGRKRCAECDKYGGQLALEHGKSVTYHCHAGLVDFAAPIMAHGKRVGHINGGQVRTEELDEERLRQIAREIEVDPDGYVEAAKKIRCIEQEELDRTTSFLYRVSAIISEMAYDRYSLIHAYEEVERAAQMKSDFLANMSHEIRTPMNAVIGMAEMALREDLPPAARGYVSQIIASGKTLLTIINDILDFSKIEAGKMTIEEEEYEPMSLVNDVANIINTRIGEKDVELILDIAPNLPRKLMGDINRLKQVIINLANNAVKFTRQGQVVLKVGFRKTLKDEIRLEISVQDTGIGIKKEDMQKLFREFQQVDSKRNRNIEGTGLGLAIANRIITLMGGEIHVESEYEKGSRFSFWIPQKIFDDQPSIVVCEKEKITAAGLVANDFLRTHIEKDMEYLGIPYFSLESEDDLEKIVENEIPYFFVGQGMFSPEVEDFVKSHPEINTILMIDFRNTVKLNIPNLQVVKKPLYVLNIASIFNGEDAKLGFGYSVQDDFDFIAPDAEILIVDDNAINLTVAEGLLEPLRMSISTATGGKEAVEMISQKKYDLIFMDHMMPEIDGVETTHLIRRFHKEYDDVPIIALTANAVGGTKEMFIREGMNDFVAKPIEMRTMLSKLKAWLPKHKIKKVYEMANEETGQQEVKYVVIDGLDTEAAMKLLGTEKLFWAVLKDYYQVIEKKANSIKQLEEAEDWHGYTIEVHALKSASKQIGAMELSEKAARMEKAGNEQDAVLIHQCTDELLEQYLGYLEILKPYFPEEHAENIAQKEMVESDLRGYFDNIRTAAEELDFDAMEYVLEVMSEYKYEGMHAEWFAQLKDAVSEYDVDRCEEVLQEWEDAL